MKKVMVRAWNLAKLAVKKFGGKAKDYFSQALTVAWKEAKVAMEELVKVFKFKTTEMEVSYYDYKNKFNKCKKVKDSYNPATKTIKIIQEEIVLEKEVTKDELKEIIAPILIVERENGKNYWSNLKELKELKHELVDESVFKVENIVFGFDDIELEDDFFDELAVEELNFHPDSICLD